MNVVALSQGCLPCGRPQAFLKAPKGTCDTDLLLRKPSGTSTHALLAGNAGHRCLTTPRRSPRPCRVRAVATGTDKKPKSQASAMEAAEKRWESQVRGFLQLLDLPLLVCNTAYIERLVLQNLTLCLQIREGRVKNVTPAAAGQMVKVSHVCAHA